MRTCAEETKDDKGRDLCCMAEAVPGLPHCREHALARLNADRQRALDLLDRLKHRAAMLIEREVEFDELTADQERDRSALSSARARITVAQEQLAKHILEVVSP